MTATTVQLHCYHHHYNSIIWHSTPLLVSILERSVIGVSIYTTPYTITTTLTIQWSLCWRDTVGTSYMCPYMTGVPSCHGPSFRSAHRIWTSPNIDNWFIKSIEINVYFMLILQIWICWIKLRKYTYMCTYKLSSKKYFFSTWSWKFMIFHTKTLAWHLCVNKHCPVLSWLEPSVLMYFFFWMAIFVTTS